VLLARNSEQVNLSTSKVKQGILQRHLKSATTNGMNVATALRELADKTNEKNLQEALKASKKSIKEIL